MTKKQRSKAMPTSRQTESLHPPSLTPLATALLASSSHPYKDQSYKNCIETAPFWAEAKFASLFLKTARVTQQTGRKTCAEIGLSKNFAQTENEPEILVRGARSPRRPNFTVWGLNAIQLTVLAACTKTPSV